MEVEQIIWTAESGWQDSGAYLKDAHLVIYFGGQGVLDTSDRYEELKARYPNAHLLGCSTGGEIYGDEVIDQSIVAVAMVFDRTELRTVLEPISDNKDSYHVGEKIAQTLNDLDLTNIFLLSDGVCVNGSDLVKGLYSVLDKKVIVTGGVAGDGADFQKTLVGINTSPESHQVAAVGFYGDALKVHYGSVGGWDAFGIERVITRSDSNILYELDGKPALDLYKEYLGDEAKDLPGSGLLFPLSIRPSQDSKHDMVRTIVGIDEEKKALIFAGDVPEGYIAQFMQGNFHNLVEGAARAAKNASQGAVLSHSNSLALLVSCIGRKLLLGQSISDEAEAISDVFEGKVPTIGFYSYGEICHQQYTGDCTLHNQTMTVTVLYES